MKGVGARVVSPMCRHTAATSGGMERSAYANVIRLDGGLKKRADTEIILDYLQKQQMCGAALIFHTLNALRGKPSKS